MSKINKVGAKKLSKEDRDLSLIAEARDKRRLFQGRKIIWKKLVLGKGRSLDKDPDLKAKVVFAFIEFMKREVLHDIGAGVEEIRNALKDEIPDKGKYDIATVKESIEEKTEAVKEKIKEGISRVYDLPEEERLELKDLVDKNLVVTIEDLKRAKDAEASEIPS